MKQTDIARRAGITPLHLNAVLAGRRNSSPKLAVRLEQITGIGREIWVFGGREERRAAWNKAKFNREGKA